GVVDHAFYDDRAGRIVGARLGAECEVAHAAGVDVARPHHPRRGGARHGIGVLVRRAHPEAAPDDARDLFPAVAGPATPVLEVHPIAGQIGREPADTDCESGTRWVHCAGPLTGITRGWVE